MALTYKEISEIIRLIDASSLDEFVVEAGDIRLSVRRRGTGDAAAASASPGALGAAAADARADTRVDVRSDAGAATAAPDAGAGAAAQAGAHADGLVEVRSPMVGVFYRRPAPDAPPYVEVGDQVRPGDPLCVIEVMKLFTTLHAEVSGRVVEIAVNDAGVVEYDQRLFLIEPD